MRVCCLLPLFLLACRTADPGTATTVSSVAPSDADVHAVAGMPCGYACGGPACDLVCAGNELFRCTPQGTWMLQESCSASGKICTFSLIEGGPNAIRSCQ
jgi:hypothetical protein